MKRPQYRLGTLYQEPCKNSWHETDEQGQRVLGKEIVGTVRELRTTIDAQTSVEALRLKGHTEKRGYWILNGSPIDLYLSRVTPEGDTVARDRFECRWHAR